MGTSKRFAPILPVRDLGASLAHYDRLGFSTREYQGGGYGFASLDGAEIHLQLERESHGHGSCYLFVEDADELAERWRSAGAEVSLPGPTDWGQHEGSHVDPDGNLIRFGSPMRRRTNREV